MLLLCLAASASARGQSFDEIEARARAARDQNHLEDAAALYRKALALRPDWAEGWWDLGTVLYDRDAYADAAEALRKASQLNPQSDVAFAMLGLAEAKAGGDPKAALGDIDKGWRLGASKQPDLRPVLLFTRGTLLLATGDFGLAQETLGALVRDGVQTEECLMALGESVLGIRPADLAPDARDVVRQAGWAEHFAARRETREARNAYEALAASAPRFHDVQFAYGRFLLESHEDAKAVEAFQREIVNSPNHLLARLGIAGIQAVQDPAAGIPYAKQAVQLAPHLAEAHYLLGLLLLNTGDFAAAIPELETAQRQAPRIAKVYFALGRAYSDAGRNEDAKRARERFAKLTAEEKDHGPAH